MAGVSTLLTTGFDAFTNLFDITIQPPSNIPTPLLYINDANPNILSVRALEFTPPELEPNTYKVPYQQVEIPRIGSKITGNRGFGLKFRIDTDYNLYQDLLTWKHMYVNPDTDTINYDATLTDTPIGSNTGSLTVNPLASTNSIPVDSPVYAANAQWFFSGVRLLKVGTPSYTRGDGSPVTVECEFIFTDYSEPGVNQS